MQFTAPPVLLRRDPTKRSKSGFKASWRLFVKCGSVENQPRDPQIDSHALIQLSHPDPELFTECLLIFS